MLNPLTLWRAMDRWQRVHAVIATLLLIGVTVWTVEGILHTHPSGPALAHALILAAPPAAAAAWITGQCVDHRRRGTRNKR